MRLHAYRSLPSRRQVRGCPAATKEDYWAGDGMNGKPSIVIDLTGQRAYFYKDDKLVGESTISSGKKGFETLPGHT